MKIKLEDYFSFENDIFFETDDVVNNLNEEFVLEGENYLNHVGIDTSNIYFKLLAQLYFLKDKNITDNLSLAHINYIIAYYVGLFLHPSNGELIALKFIDEAIGLENDNSKIEKYKELKAMIKEEL